MNLTDDQRNHLVDDGDSLVVTAEGGKAYRLTVRYESDNDTTINDFETYGRVSAWTRDSDYGSQRPHGFGPHARILDSGPGSTIWWEPLPELWGTPKPWTPETFESDWRLARTLWHDGFTMVGVILDEQVTDSLGGEHWVTIDQQWLGGCDTLDDPAFRKDVTGDLIHELPDLDITE